MNKYSTQNALIIQLTATYFTSNHCFSNDYVNQKSGIQFFNVL